MAQDNRVWTLANRPQGDLKPGDLKLETRPMPTPADGEILVQTIYLSLDPTNRVWMNEAKSYLPPVGVGDMMRGLSLGRVVSSKADGFAEGDIVIPSMGGWADYITAPAKGSAKPPVELGAPLPAFLSVLGMTGLTAYFGLLDIGEPKPGETVLVSAAAGAVGSIACQLAKIEGARVVGIAGSDEKCAWLTGELGIDGAINYKTEKLSERIRALCPDGVDVYFENVGGPTLDAALAAMNNFGRIPLCGLISNYNADTPQPGPYRFGDIIMKRLKVQGFVILDYGRRYEEALKALAGHLAAGKLHYKVDVVDGLENAPDALGRLFTGANAGKLMVQVSPE